MEALTDPAKLQLFLLFAVPGLVALCVRSQFLTGRMPPVAEGIVAYVTLSLVYHAAVFPLVAALGQNLATWQRALGWIGLLFGLPALLGAVLGLNIRKGWTKTLLKKAGITTVHPINAAWDWRFGNCPECWVIACLKDGTQWAGYLGTQSFMSSDPAERDIYIQKVYDVDDKTQAWTQKATSVWIAHAEIRSLEFWPMQQGS